MSHVNKLKNGAVIAAAIIFAGLLVKEWFEVKTADEAAIKAGHPIVHAGFSVGSMFNNITASYDAQQQFFNRLDNAAMYAPDPMLEKLDIDDKVILRKYRDQPRFFTQKLAEMHVDINTVLVRPDPAPIRLVALKEETPALLWHLFLLTGNDTATLLEDGIHIKRQGFPEQILGGHFAKDDRRCHGQMGTILWRRDRKGWSVEQAGKTLLWQVSVTEIADIKKHENRGPAFHLDCNALRKFGRPLQPGETSREMTAKVDIAVTPAERAKFPRGQVCNFNLGRTPLDW